MQPYGTNGCDCLKNDYGSLDVADVQAALPNGHRIRNKKQKRRFHKKKTRQSLKKQLNKEIKYD